MKKHTVTVLLILLLVGFGVGHILTKSPSDEPLRGIESLDELYHGNVVVYFGRPTCITCIETEPHLIDLLNNINSQILYYNTQYWKNQDGHNEVLDDFDVESIPRLVKIKDGVLIETYVLDSSTILDAHTKESIQEFIVSF